MDRKLESLESARAAELTQSRTDQRALLHHLVAAFRDAGCTREAAKISELMVTTCGNSDDIAPSYWAGPWKVTGSNSKCQRAQIWRVLMAMQWQMYVAGEYGLLQRSLEVALESESRFMASNPRSSPASLGYNHPYQLRIQLVTLSSGLGYFNKAEEILRSCEATDKYWELMLLLAAAENKIGQGLVSSRNFKVAAQHLDDASSLLAKAADVLQSHPGSIKNVDGKATRLITDEAIISHIRGDGNRTAAELWQDVELKARQSRTGSSFVIAMSLLARCHLQEKSGEADLLGQQAITIWERTREPAVERFYQPFIGTIWAITLQHWLKQDDKNRYAGSIIRPWQPQLIPLSTSLVHRLPDSPKVRMASRHSHAAEKEIQVNSEYDVETAWGPGAAVQMQKRRGNRARVMKTLGLIFGLIAGFAYLSQALDR